jgi:tetratricopeptide (TPR) repeat protein
MRRISLVTLTIVLVAAAAAAQSSITLPPNGDNQRSSVTQHIGLVAVTIDYSSPDVHAPNGDDRRGKIFGTDVAHYGLRDQGFGTSKAAPWRAGANENTVFTVSHDVKVEGQPLPAGRYGLFMIGDPNEWTVVFSKNSTSWGSYFYDPAEDALRVKVKPSKSEYNEWLTYEFIDRKTDRATVALKWEDLQVPFTVSVDNVTDLYIGQIKKELRTNHGFSWSNWNAAARYALNQKRLDQAMEWATTASDPNSGFGQENFATLMTLADVQEAAGKAAESKVTRDKALAHATANAGQIHQYARRLMNQKKNDDALKVFELNAKRYPNAWPVNAGLARGYSAVGRYKDALKYAKLALAQAPDEQNRKFLEDGIKKLEAGKDMNL